MGRLQVLGAAGLLVVACALPKVEIDESLGDAGTNAGKSGGGGKPARAITLCTSWITKPRGSSGDAFTNVIAGHGQTGPFGKKGPLSPFRCRALQEMQAQWPESSQSPLRSAPVVGTRNGDMVPAER